MTDIQHKKFEKWLEPFVLGFKTIEEESYLETSDTGIILIGGPEHERWLNEKKIEFIKAEPPLAGIVYAPWVIHERTQEENKQLEVSREIAYQEWEKQHSLCPKCDNTQMIHSLAGVIWHAGKPYEDNINKAVCGRCGWSGKVHELKPKHNETTSE